LPEHPGVFPGAPLPAKPAIEVLQAQPLGRGAQPVPAQPGAALAEIPVPKPETVQVAAPEKVSPREIGTPAIEEAGNAKSGTPRAARISQEEWDAGHAIEPEIENTPRPALETQPKTNDFLKTPRGKTFQRTYQRTLEEHQAGQIPSIETESEPPIPK